MSMFLNVTNVKIILMFLLVSVPIAILLMLRLVRPLRLRLRSKILWSTLILLVVWFAALALPLTLRTAWYPEIYHTLHLEQLLPLLYYDITFLCVLFLLLVAVDIVLAAVKLVQYIRAIKNKKDKSIENTEIGNAKILESDKNENIENVKIENVENCNSEKIENTDKLESVEDDSIKNNTIESGDADVAELPKNIETEQLPVESKPQGTPMSRREFLGIVRSAGIAGGALALTPAAVYYAKTRRVVRQIEIRLPSIPAGLDGFKIVHLSDIHVGNTIYRDDIADIVAETNALEPDMIAITGDMADGFPDLIGDWIDPMQDFKARYGTWFVTGNHDHMWNAAGWCEKIASLGIHVLDNAHEIVDVNGTRFAVAGALDYRGDRRNRNWKSDPAKALTGIPHNLFRLMLVHQPSSVDTCFKLGADLVLLGHTHGGQFWPLSYIINAMHKYAHGLYMVGDKAAFVSCGTGYWGPPLRFGVPPEIDVVTLRSPVVLNG